jgi:Aminopeptidase I zinc metalloprotease (M18)
MSALNIHDYGIPLCALACAVLYLFHSSVCHLSVFALSRHEPQHQPALHKGLVIKTNANQRYASNAVSSALFREVARVHGIPTQEFVVRSDMACGSTIGDQPCTHHWAPPCLHVAVSVTAVCAASHCCLYDASGAGNTVAGCARTTHFCGVHCCNRAGVFKWKAPDVCPCAPVGRAHSCERPGVSHGGRGAGNAQHAQHQGDVRHPRRGALVQPFRRVLQRFLAPGRHAGCGWAATACRLG